MAIKLLNKRMGLLAGDLEDLMRLLARMILI